ncbi:MAG: gamma-glutamyl-gamma-aminobutyrate hydrolase family protein [bacterium]
MIKKILIAPRVHNHEILPMLALDSRLSNFLLKSGFLPILLPISDDFETNKKLSDSVFETIGDVQGIILQGGDDIDPSLYNNLDTKNSAHRDHFEKDLLLEAVKQNKSVLGICRGMQMINIAFGGDLLQDLGELNRTHLRTTNGNTSYLDFKVDHADISLGHEIEINEQSPLNKILDKQIPVNSVHHQAVGRLGEDLMIDARAGDGTVEIISNWQKNILGLQFHPEFDLKNLNFNLILDFWLSKI